MGKLTGDYITTKKQRWNVFLSPPREILRVIFFGAETSECKCRDYYREERYTKDHRE